MAVNMNSNDSIGLVFNYLSENKVALQRSVDKLVEFEEIVATAPTNVELAEVLQANGWTGKHFGESFCYDDCLVAVGSLLMSHLKPASTPHAISEAEIIFPFLPLVLIAHVTTRLNESNAIFQSSMYSGAIMSIQITEMSQLTEALTSRGSKGLEELMNLASQLMLEAIQLVTQFGGDVVSSDGMSLLCIFVEESTTGMAEHKGSTLVAAVLCGLLARQLCQGVLRTKIALTHGLMKFSVVGGNDENWSYVTHGSCLLELLTLPTTFQEQQFYMSKDCHDLLLRSLQELMPAGQQFCISSKEDNDECGSLPILNSFAVDGSCFHQVDYMSVPQFDNQTTSKFRAHALKHASFGEVVAALQLFMQPAVLAAVCSDTLDRNMVELRNVTTLCVEMTSQADESAAEAIEMLPALYRTVQQVLHTSGGYLKQFVQRKDGWLAVIMWGVPLSSYASNCSRSLFCAMSLRKHAHFINWKCSIGIATGTAFTGLLGSTTRQDYAVIGQAVSYAEQLMHQSNGSALIALETYLQLTTSAQDKMQIAKFKGSTDNVFEFIKHLSPDLEMLNEYLEDTRNCVLQPSVSMSLLSQLDKVCNSLTNTHTATKQRCGQFIRNGSSSSAGSNKSTFHHDISTLLDPVFTVILGSPGTGKSTALRYVQQTARRRMLPCIHVLCRPGEEAKPFGLVARIFLEIIGPKNFDDEVKQRQVVDRILCQLGCTDEVTNDAIKMTRFHALRAILGLQWELDELLEPDDGVVNTEKYIEKPAKVIQDVAKLSTNRNDKTFSEVLSILLRNKRTVILIDDAHCSDELSWYQLHQVMLGTTLCIAVFMTSRVSASGSSVLSKPQVIALATTFTIINSSSSGSSSQCTNSFTVMNNCVSVDEQDGVFGAHNLERMQNSAYVAILAHELCVVLELNLLGEVEVGDVLARVLGSSLDARLIVSVHNFTGGNPYWVNTVALFIKHHGITAFMNAINAQTLSSGQNPLGALITARFDLCTAAVQVLGRHACVIGDQFDIALLSAIVPADMVNDVKELVEELRASNFVSLIDDKLQLYAFQNTLIRGTLYGMLAASAAASIHLAIARHLDTIFCEDYPVISYHYRKSVGCRYMALKFTIKSAKRSLRHGAFAEGFAFLQTALPLAVTRPELRAMSLITSQAMRLLNPPAGIVGLLRRMSSHENLSEHAQLYAKYNQFHTDIEKTLTYMSQKPITEEEVVDNTSQQDVNRDLTLDELNESENIAPLFSGVCVIS